MSEATVTSVTTTRIPGSRRKRRRQSHGLAGFLFTAPFMVLFLAFFIAPLIYALYLSLYREQLVGGNEFVGLNNYKDGISDHAFTSGVGRVALYMVVQVPVMLGLALAFALILDSAKVWFPKLFRIAFFMPYAVPPGLAGLLWGYPYGKDFGPCADVADKLGTSPPDFLSEQWMLWSIAN